MKTIDKIYGRFEINESILLDFIKSKPVQRLKKINQFGVPDRFYHLKNYSRYDHSIGVMLILKKLGAPLEEQIAGLLHDVSHTAFSHVVDWLFGNNVKEDSQDKQHRSFANNYEMKKIAKKYRYSLVSFFEYKNFSLLEREIPDLCADRLDYSLKEFPLSVAKYCFDNLENKNGKMVFKNKKSALIFAKNFLKLQKNHWGGFEAVMRYTLLSEALRIALENKIISFDDFLSYDDFIIKKIEKSKNKKILKILKLLKNKKLKQPKNGEKTKIYHKKFRYVDPEFIDNDGNINLLSSIDKTFKNLLEKSKKENEKGIKVPLGLF